MEGVTSRQSLRGMMKLKGWTIEFKIGNRLLFDFALEELERQAEGGCCDIRSGMGDESQQGNVMTEYEERYFSSMVSDFVNILMSVAMPVIFSVIHRHFMSPQEHLPT